MLSDKSRDQIWSEWRDLVNMASNDIEDWLATDESKSVGDSAGPDSTGRASGRKIIEIKRTNKDDLTDADWDHMAKGGRVYQTLRCTGAGPARRFKLGLFDEKLGP